LQIHTGDLGAAFVKVALVDYGSGNLRSAAKAFERSVLEAELKADIVVTNDAKIIASADKVVLPGVGAFRDCRDGIASLPGVQDAVEQAATVRQVPFLGICVGMQLMATLGKEFGDTAGFGFVPGVVQPIQLDDPSLKIPHMGWNSLSFISAKHAIFDGIGPGEYFYFVHSYAFRAEMHEHVIAEVHYGGRVTAAIGTANVVGLQFHPEKSQAAGLKVIQNFLRWEP
jgi:glutamine amidotransferase